MSLKLHAQHPNVTEASSPLLQVRDLSVEFRSDDGIVRAVDQVSFSLAPGQTLGIVGESGSGKSAMSLSLLGLLPPSARIGGSVRFRGRELLGLPERQWSRVRGNRISMVFQDPMTSLNPFLPIGEQLVESLRIHEGLRRGAAETRGIALLDRVGIPSAGRRLNDYPHQFSGGMRQRVMIAMALACRPDVVIADEPTTALDVTIQAQILELLCEIQQEAGMALILITHDLGVVAEVCDWVRVMYAGRFVESAAARDLFQRPRHPYTLGLLESIPQWQESRATRLIAIPGQPPHLAHLTPGCAFAPRCTFVTDRCHQFIPPLVARPPAESSAPGGEYACLVDVRASDPSVVASGGAAVEKPSERGVDVPLLTVDNLRVSFKVRRGGFWNGRRGEIRAVDGLSLSIAPGETLGLVGESGSGKSTVARVIVGLQRPTSGSLRLFGQPCDWSREPARSSLRRQVQMVFQDPFASLNPRMTIERTIAEPLRIFQMGTPRDQKSEVLRMMELVGLNPRLRNRYPHECSGGQRQRIGIARALAVQPKLLVCDEPVSALDVSIQAQIINLLMDLQQRLGLSYLFIAHDLSVVRHVSTRVGVMYAGQLVELAESAELFRQPRHPYTQSLLSAVPLASVTEKRPERIVLAGEPSSPEDRRAGCPLAPRCPLAEPRCTEVVPLLRGTSHQTACHLVSDDVSAR